MGPLIPIPENGCDRAKRVSCGTDILFDANSLSLFDDLVWLNDTIPTGWAFAALPREDLATDEELLFDCMTPEVEKISISFRVFPEYDSENDDVEKSSEPEGINEVLVNTVYHLMLNIEKDMSVNEVAFELGFSSVSSFSRAFYNEFNIRPSGLRIK